MRFDHRPTRFLSACIFSVGLAYSLVAMLSGRFNDPTVVIAVVVESVLIVASLIRPAPIWRDYGIISLLVVSYLLVATVFAIMTELVIIVCVGLVLYAVLVGQPTVSIDLDHRSTRMLSAGISAAGLLYAFIVLVAGRVNDPTVIVAIVVESALMTLSLRMPPPGKIDYGLIMLAVAVYIPVTVINGIFTEMVLMACGGLILYAVLMSDPRFPLTKRALVTGLIVGTIMTFLGIYLALKLGVVYFIGAEMLGALLLSIGGRYTKEENTIVVAISNGSSAISVGTLITFPAIAIFDNPLQPVAPDLLTYPFIAFVTGISAFFGLILLVPFRGRFEKDPWPQVKPQAAVIISIGADRKAKKDVSVGLAAAGTYVGAVRVAEAVTAQRLTSFPGPLMPLVPDWIGISNSPLIAAIGYFVGWKRVLALLMGSAIAVSIWVVLEGASLIPYADHLHRPEVLYLVLGAFAAVIYEDVLRTRKNDILTPEQFERELSRSRAHNSGEPEPVQIDEPHRTEDVLRRLRVREELFSISDFRDELRSMIANPHMYLQRTRGRLPPWLGVLSISIFTVIGIVVFSVIRPFYNLDIHWMLFVLGAPLVLISAYFTARAISETAMLAGYISDIVAIPAIILLRVSFQAITTFMAMLGAIQDAAIAVLLHLKLGSLTGVRGRDIVKAVFIGAILATIGGSLMIYGIYKSYGFGGSDFPSPTAQLFGFLVTSLQGLGEFKLPGMDDPVSLSLDFIIPFAYLLSFGILGYVVGLILNRRGLSAMSFAVGLLVPPATSAAMLIGGLVDYRVKHRVDANQGDVGAEIGQSILPDGRMSRIISGIVAGEAVVTAIWVLWTAVNFFLV